MYPELRRDRGFTLLEVLVALAVTGIVVLAARAVVAQLGDDGERIAATARRDSREANGWQLARDLLGRAQMAGEAGSYLAGDARAVRFTSSCDVPAGWQERCLVRIGVVDVGGTSNLALALSTGETVVLHRGARPPVLRYLQDPGNGGTWLGAWNIAYALPWAIGVEVEGELAILPIGERG